MTKKTLIEKINEKLSVKLVPKKPLIETMYDHRERRRFLDEQWHPSEVFAKRAVAALARKLDARIADLERLFERASNPITQEEINGLYDGLFEDTKDAFEVVSDMIRERQIGHGHYQVLYAINTRLLERVRLIEDPMLVERREKLCALMLALEWRMRTLAE